MQKNGTTIAHALLTLCPMDIILCISETHRGIEIMTDINIAKTPINLELFRAKLIEDGEEIFAEIAALPDVELIRFIEIVDAS